MALRQQLGDTPQGLRDLSISHYKLGDVLRELGRPDDAAAHWHQAVDLYRSLHQRYGESLDSLLHMTVPLTRLADAGNTDALAELHTLKQRLTDTAPDHPRVRGLRPSTERSAAQ